ncbi:hypothetical protein DF188_09695 [Aliarcobacter skirrowii]|uniref:Uncharacterized protein n=2 Tax=Aliarcobacter TaxID=2321111 RepID=A0A2U2BYE0_9BACT|nr:hypothetical protein [Aliarcobacter skirrowii]PWE19544.1 hypothetical protein DF188_09695 [Aliarcobacter skirrowii]
MNGYEKLKTIIKVFLKRNPVFINNSEFVENKISKDVFYEHLKNFKKANFVIKHDKESNIINKNLLNDELFFNNEYNEKFFSALFSREQAKDCENTINYFFKEIPEKNLFNIINLYSEDFNKQIIHLLDQKKLSFFKILSSDGYTNYKICEILDSKNNKYHSVVILKIFILKDSWFICTKDVKTEEILIFNSIDIEDAKDLDKNYTKITPKEDISIAIDNFIKNKNVEKSFYVKMKAETLNFLLNYKLIDENFITYRENYPEFGFINSNHKVKNKLLKININNIEKYTPNYKSNSFSKTNSKEYIFFIKTSNIDFILNSPNTLLIDINKYDLED